MVNHVLEPFFNIAENVGVNYTENDIVKYMARQTVKWNKTQNSEVVLREPRPNLVKIGD